MLISFYLQENTSGFNQIEKTHPLPTSSPRVKMEGLSDSPLGHRPRSSTVSSAGGDTMRREFMAKRAAAKKKLLSAKTESESSSQVSPKRNMYVPHF